ncbi:RNA polymerase II elongation factor [Chytridiales sp. JEL 0842]|nr:RNA polymerase II elongation factor [Chytridiales sp. JEL 0842]
MSLETPPNSPIQSLLNSAGGMFDQLRDRFTTSFHSKTPAEAPSSKQEGLKDPFKSPTLARTCIGAYEFSIQGLKCEGCASNLKSSLLKQEGVKGVQVHFTDKRLLVEGEMPSNNARRKEDWERKVREYVAMVDFTVYRARMLLSHISRRVMLGCSHHRQKKVFIAQPVRSLPKVHDRPKHNPHDMATDKDVIKWRKEIEEAIADGNHKVVVATLKMFEPWKPTTESLKNTKIGLFLNELRKHSNANDEIIALAKGYITKWKNMIAKEVGAAAPSPATKNPTVKIERKMSTNSVDSSTKTVDSPRTPPSTSAGTPLRERSYKIDGVSAKSVGDRIRDKTIELIYAAVGMGTDHDSERILKIATKIEAALHTEHKGTSDKYKSQFRTLVANFKDKENSQLRERVLTGELTPGFLATATSDDLMSDNMKKAQEEAQKHALHFAVTAPKQEAETDAFKCGRCGKRQCTYYQKQTRSADEPMTTFVVSVFRII